MSKFHSKSYSWFKNQNLFIKIIVVIAIAAVVIGTLMFLLSLAVTALWNWLMPDIFGLPTITQLQAVGLILLVGIFKGVVSGNSTSNNNVSKSKYPQEKDDFDAMYEKWWNEKGEASFNEYVENE